MEDDNQTELKVIQEIINKLSEDQLNELKEYIHNVIYIE